MRLLKHIKWPGIAAALILALLLTNHGSIFRLALTAGIPPGIITPTSLVITLDEVTVEEDINGEFRYTVFNTPASLDVVKNTGLPTNIFGGGGVTPVTHNGIEFVLNGKGTYSGVDPCTGLDATDESISLPDVDPVSNQLIERLQVRHPVTGLQSGATGEIDPFHVGSDPVTLKLIFPASNSVGCLSDKAPLQVISGAGTGIVSPFGIAIDPDPVNNGIYVSNNDSKANSIVVFNRSDSGNVTPRGKIQGPTTGLDTPGGIFVYNDSTYTSKELEVANFGNDSISIYDLKTWDPAVADLAPIHVISGAATGLNGPGGVYEYNDEIYVANGPDDSITVYTRPQSADPVNLNVPPQRIIKGPTTGLNTPCGVYVGDIVLNTVDAGLGIAVLNNGNSSITFYTLSADSSKGDVSPLLTIKGDKTAISNACDLYVDATNNEVAVSSAGFNSINFYSLDPNLSGEQNVYPKRRIMGTNTQLVQPVGVSLDTANDAVAVANIGSNAVTLFNRNDATPHLLHHPVFINPKVQQQLLVSYIYKGQILSSTGKPLAPTDPATGQPYTNDPITNEPLTNVDPITQERLPIPLAQGYAYVFKVYDPTMHSASDVNSAYLIPPSKMQFQLADGSAASNLLISCQVFTPFTTDELTTNCLSQALIISPFPPQPILFHIAATVVGKVQNKTFVPNIAPLRKSELPLVLPQVTLSPTGAILDINWTYVNDAGQQLGLAPLITSQSFQVTYSKPYDEISACYKRRVNPVLAFSSGALSPSIRTLPNVKDTGCDIFLRDVTNITFTALDAYENRYAYSWDVID
jgi:hypothetical protein